MINNRVVETIRTIFTASLNAFSHTHLWGKGFYSEIGVRNQFMSGLASGILLEKSQNIFHPILSHIFFNLICMKTRYQV